MTVIWCWLGWHAWRRTASVISVDRQYWHCQRCLKTRVVKLEES